MKRNCEPSTMIAPTVPAIAPLANITRVACRSRRTPPYPAKRAFFPRMRSSKPATVRRSTNTVRMAKAAITRTPTFSAPFKARSRASSGTSAVCGRPVAVSRNGKRARYEVIPTAG
jgi:hypothetical protein